MSGIQRRLERCQSARHVVAVPGGRALGGHAVRRSDALRVTLREQCQGMRLLAWS